MLFIIYLFVYNFIYLLYLIEKIKRVSTKNKINNIFIKHINNDNERMILET